MKKNSLVFMFAIAILAKCSYAYIEKMLELSLVGDRQVLLMFDAYEGYTSLFNKQNAVAIAAAVKNISYANSEKRIDFSYEDPAVYEAGNLLKTKLPLFEPHVSTADNEFLALLQTAKAKRPIFHLLKFKKPPRLTSLLAGDLTRTLAIFAESLWPANLTLRSNDPRQSYMLALTNGQSWLLANQKSIRVRNLITPSSLLHAKRIAFAIDDQLSEKQKAKLFNIFDEFKNTEDDQVEAFANFLSAKGLQITAPELRSSIFDLSKKVSLDLVHEFITEMKKHFDVYSDGPIVDVLLTMFAKNHPDIMVIILGNHLAMKLTNILGELNVIEQGCHIANAAEYIAQIATRNLPKSQKNI